MKKVMFLMMMFIASISLSVCLLSCDDPGASSTKAQIIAEDMVKQDVLSADDLEFDAQGVEETSNNEYHVVANIKTLNGMGLLMPRKVSVRLKYNGSGDWTDINNWTEISIKYLDESSGNIQ